MAVRTFTMPTSLNESLTATKHATPETAAVGKSLKDSYTDAQRQPLSAQKKTPQPGITYAAQDKLPKLPIPELESTCQKYLDALKPLQTLREYEDTESAVQDFLKRDGPELNERLKKYATGKTSYIEQFCK